MFIILVWFERSLTQLHTLDSKLRLPLTIKTDDVTWSLTNGHMLRGRWKSAVG